MRDPEKEALRMVRFWLAKCEKLGVNVNGINGVNAKKKEGGKKAPPTPPIKKGGRKKKTTTTTTARACEEIFPPTLEMVDAFAQSLNIPRDFAATWFNNQRTVNRWLHPKSGLPLLGWRSSLRVWWKRRGEFDPIPETETDRANKEETFDSLKGLVS